MGVLYGGLGIVFGPNSALVLYVAVTGFAVGKAPHLYTSMVSKPLGSTRLHCSNALADAWYSTISACALPFKQSAYAVFLCLWCNRASDSTHSRPRNIERCASAS